MKRLVLLAIAGLGLAVLPITAAAGGGCHPMSKAPSTVDARGNDNATIPIESCEFKATVLRVDPGTTVTWTNNDPLPHTVTGALRSFGGYTDLNQGEVFDQTFDDEGIYLYSCIYHPEMVGAVMVGDGVGPTSSAAAAGVTFSDDDPTGASSETVAAPSEGVSLPVLLAIAGLVAIAAFGLGVTYRRRKHLEEAAQSA